MAVAVLVRAPAYLEKLFDMLNADLFDSELERPIITLIPSSRSYGHYVPSPIWNIKDEQRRELNIATGTLRRPGRTRVHIRAVPA